jgi:AcrR family transcriptional regulator
MESLPKWQDLRIVEGMTVELGLRERKKLATRAALSDAAWSLMIEKGLDAVTPEAVAEAADLSPRTFRNYFASREEAILDRLDRRAGSITEAIRARPADEPLWTSFAEVLPAAAADLVGSHNEFLVLMAVIEANPAMLAQHLVAFEHGHTLMVKLIAERTGTDAERDLAPRLLAAAMGVAIKSSIDLWAATGADLPGLIREAIAQLRAGLPLGAAAPAA